MEENIRKVCKWMEVFDSYETNKYLCHLNVDSKYVKFEENCKNCPHYEKCNE